MKSASCVTQEYHRYNRTYESHVFRHSVKYKIAT